RFDIEGANMVVDFDGTEYLVLADAWNQPLWYQPWTSYLDIDNAVNPDSFQLWSFGPDGLNDVIIKHEGDERWVGVRHDDDPIPYGDDVVAWQ
ncbi:MAG: hypothetical protein ACOCXA_07155, partial [Planctomycetota bacterium]